MDDESESRIKILERKVEGLEDEVYKGGVMKKICKNCKWWDYSEDSLNPEGYGFCNIPQMVYRPQKDNMFYSKRSAPLVGENFGCIHFEAKEPEYNIPS